MKIFISLITLLALSGCLKTRAELSDDSSGNMRTDSGGTYVSGKMGQQQRAQIDSRFFEIDRDFRELYGKIETIERGVDELKARPQNSSGLGASSAVDSEKLQALEKRISTIEEALLALDKKLSKLSSRKDTNAQVIKVIDTKGPFGKGEMHFANNQFEQAIASYDEYRKRYPRGRRYAQATLKMGLAFQRLKMNEDAKAFYKEVIQRYPNTAASNRAEENLKRL